MNKLLSLAFLPLALLLLIGVAACGDDDDDASDDAETTETATADDDVGDDSDDDSSDDDSDDGDDSDDDAGDDAGEVDPYYVTMEEIAVQADEELDAIGDILNATSNTDPDYVDVVRNGFNDAGQILETVLVEVAQLDPPAEAEAAHDDFVTDLGTQLSNFADFSEDAEDVATADELDALFDDYNAIFTEGDTNFEASCLAVQEVADSVGANVDLECGV